MATAPTPAPTTPRTSLTMRAFVLRRVNEVGVVDKPIPEPGPNDAVVLTTAALICSSDVHTAKGVIPLPPDRTLGHEAVGRVWRLGSEVTGFAEGDGVLVNAITPLLPVQLLPARLPPDADQGGRLHQTPHHLPTLRSDARRQKAERLAAVMPLGPRRGGQAGVPHH